VIPLTHIDQVNKAGNKTFSHKLSGSGCFGSSRECVSEFEVEASLRKNQYSEKQYKSWLPLDIGWKKTEYEETRSGPHNQDEKMVDCQKKLW